MLTLGTSVSTKDARSFVPPSTLLGWSWLGQTCCILDLIRTFEHNIDFILSQFSLLLVWPFTLPYGSVSPFSGSLPPASFYVACSSDGQALPHLDILVLAIQDVIRMGTAEKLTPRQTCRSPGDCARLAFILYTCCLSVWDAISLPPPNPCHYSFLYEALSFPKSPTSNSYAR